MRRFDTPAALLGAVACGAFLETTILPVPFELLLVPVMLARPRWLWAMAGAALAGCLVGTLAGYLVGAFALESVGRTVLPWLGADGLLEGFTTRLNRDGFWALVLVGFTPVPVQVATLAAGVAGYPLASFLLAMLLSRALRYFALAWLVARFGERTLRIIRRHRRTALLAGTLLIPLIVWLLL